MKQFKSTFIGVSIAVATLTYAYASSDTITNWDDGFDTSGKFETPIVSNDGLNELLNDDANVFDANKSYEYNFAKVTDNSVTPLLSDATMSAMELAVQNYGRIAAGGGWPRITTALKSGDNNNEVIKLRQRLFLEGDLPRVSGDAKVFDYNVSQAVKRFQARNGLVLSGFVDGKTMSAMNITAAMRMNQLKLNLNRIKLAKSKLHNKSIVVNIPAMKVETVEDGRIVSRHNVVVGQADRQTPIISSTISQVNFNPYWHVPVSIVRRDVVPKIISDPTYIKRTGMRIYTTWGGKELDPATIDFTSPKAMNYAYRQDPGRDNSLGNVKLNFGNKHAVFMHDTPSKSLFARNFRAYSSGCVRIQNIRQVVDWIMRDEKKWSPEESTAALRNGDRKDLNIKSRVSVRLVYLTSWVTPAGTVHFRNDLYNRDGLSGLASIN